MALSISTHQNNQGKNVVTPIANRIAEIITAIPRLMRNIRHHIPQASLQVGLTSLSIYSLLFLCFPGSRPVNRFDASCMSSIHYKYGYQSVSIQLKGLSIK
jgi:hypothetical protein